jgi:hypothetical protein
VFEKYVAEKRLKTSSRQFLIHIAYNVAFDDPILNKIKYLKRMMKEVKKRTMNIDGYLQVNQLELGIKFHLM